MNEVLVGKKAIDLQPGDVCRGPGLFVEQGTVANTVVVDAGVQVNWVGGTHTVRPEDFEFAVGVSREDG